MDEQDISIKVHIEEDQSSTHVHAVLDLRGDHFEATGRAKRNPTDTPMPVIGEELALARALHDLQHEVMQAAHDKIEAYLAAD